MASIYRVIRARERIRRLQNLFVWVFFFLMGFAREVRVLTVCQQREISHYILLRIVYVESRRQMDNALV